MGQDALYPPSLDRRTRWLIRDVSRRGRYLTVDRWATAEAFDVFRRTHAAEYEALDARCEPWTETELRQRSPSLLRPKERFPRQLRVECPSLPRARSSPKRIRFGTSRCFFATGSHSWS